MGTRADFYVGIGKKARWIGSVAYDGYEYEDKEAVIHKCKTEKDYKRIVRKLLKDRNDATFPKDGWPWPWEDSRLTDIAYCYVKGEIKIFYFGRLDREDEGCKKCEFPNMKSIQKITFGRRSGLLLLGRQS